MLVLSYVYVYLVFELGNSCFGCGLFGLGAAKGVDGLQHALVGLVSLRSKIQVRF